MMWEGLKTGIKFFPHSYPQTLGPEKVFLTKQSLEFRFFSNSL